MYKIFIIKNGIQTTYQEYATWDQMFIVLEATHKLLRQNMSIDNELVLFNLNGYIHIK